MAQVTLFANKDSYVRQEYPNDNYGTKDRLEIYYQEGGPSTAYLYVDFDTSSIPLGAQILSATLTLTQYSGSWTWPAQSIYVERATGSWTETGITWNNRPATTQASPSVSVAAEAFKKETFNVTALVQSWANGQPRYGFAVQASSYGMKSFCSREYADQNNRPVLVVEYNRTPNPPGVSISGIGSDYQWTNVSQLTINWNFSDPDSGDYQSAYQVVGSQDGWANWQYNSGEVANGSARSVTTPTLGEGTWQFAVRTRDRYGAWSNWAYTYTVRIDRTKPTIGSVSGTQYTNGSGPVRIWAYNVTDNWSGVNRVAVTMVRPDGSTYNGGNATQSGNNWYTDVTWTGEVGTWGIRFQAYDNAGNASDTKQATVIHDRTPPTIGSTYPEQMYSNVAVNGTFRVRADGVSDDRSGVSNVRFAVWTEAGGQDDLKWYDGNNAGNGVWYYDVPINQHGNAEGKYIIHTYAYDRAGNNSSKGTEKWVDRTPPTITSPQGYSYTNQTEGRRRVWFYGVTDSITGVWQTNQSVTQPNGVNYPIDNVGQAGSDYYVDVPLSTMQGEYTVYFQAVDRAGNKSATVYSKFFIDSVRPNDPQPSVTYGTTTCTMHWHEMIDQSPSSGYLKTLLYLGKWNGSQYVGPMIYNGYTITDPHKIEQQVFDLEPGARYRYTVTQYDKAGNESAYTYKEFVTKRIVGHYHVRTGPNETITIPLYDPSSGVHGEKTVRIGVSGGVGCFELLSVNDANAVPIHISTPHGLRAVAK